MLGAVQNAMSKNKQKSNLVRGTAEVFSLDNRSNVVRTTITQRFPPSHFSKHIAAFLPNHNLHNMKDQARGTLVILRSNNGIYRLGVVVKLYWSNLSCIVSILNTGAPFQALVVGKQSTPSAFFTVVLINDMRTVYHRVLQQFHGTQVKQLDINKRTTKVYPFLGDDGCVSLNPEGPDVVPSIGTAKLPSNLLPVNETPIFSREELHAKDKQHGNGLVKAIYILEENVGVVNGDKSGKSLYGVVHGEVEWKETSE